MTWIRVCEVDEIAVGEAVPVVREPKPPIAVFRLADGYFATDDTCTHDRYSLADGYIEEDAVECPLHMARFDIRTGKALCLPATRDLHAYPVKVEDDVVYVEVAEP